MAFAVHGFALCRAWITGADVHYRADIDGLRSLAVVPILLFHAGFSSFAGGFVGVDIFFVISGFLITSILAKDMAEGLFSLALFYEKRIRRIFPALFVMLLVTSLAAWFLLFPFDLRAYGKSLIAATGFVANLWFWSQSGYFDTESELKPLLHTWSLAVEEQFYLFFPLLLMLAMRFWRDGKVMVAVLFVLSLALSVYSVRVNPDATFYLIPTRAWELLMGSALALGLVPSSSSRALREVMALVGAGLVAFAIFTFDGRTRFPGEMALLPCLGAALIIWSGGAVPTLVARALTLRPVVWTGLISYSLYLWHWPLMVFAHHLTLRKLVVSEKLALVVLSFGLAWLSYVLVEKPFRERARTMKRSVIFASALAGMSFFMALGAVLAPSGFPGRFSPELQALFDDNDRERTAFDVFKGDGKVPSGLPGNGYRLGVQPADVVAWGDSHIGAVLPGLNAAIATGAIKGASIFALGGCRPIIGIAQSYTRDESCAYHNALVLDYIRQGPETKVVLVSRWAVSLFGDTLPVGKGDMYGSLAAVPGEWMQEAAATALFERQLGATIDALNAAGKEVYLLESTIEATVNVPRYVFRSLLSQSGAPKLTLDASLYAARYTEIEAIFDRVQQGRQVTRISPRRFLCENWQCQIYGGRRLYYSDSNHLSIYGAEALTPLLLREMGISPPARRE